MKKGTEVIFYNIETGKVVNAEVLRKNKFHIKIKVEEKEMKAFETQNGWEIENFYDKIYEISIKGTQEQLDLKEKYRIKRKNIAIKTLESEIENKKQNILKKQNEIKKTEEEIKELKNRLLSIN